MAKKVLYITQNGRNGVNSRITESTKSNAFSISKGSNETGVSAKPSKTADKYSGTKFSKDFDVGSGSINMSDIVKKLHTALSIDDTASSSELFTRTATYYNRFKLPTINDKLSKSFCHVFFTRPDCNIFKNASGMTEKPVLTDTLGADMTFRNALRSSPELLRELTLKQNGRSDDFMMTLSNKATSFSLSDEYINSTTYGKTYTGYKIAYGQNNIESKTAGEFTVTYEDDRVFHIYQLHKLWVEYISGISRGVFSPVSSNIIDKILDYAASCYFIMTAEDGETIIFWSKYYGIFPTNIPSSQYSWSKGTLLQDTSLDIKYMYSFKEDYNPMTILEFNQNARLDGTNLRYAPVFDKKLGHSGSTWVGTPFIELITNNSEAACPYTYKLRFKPIE